MSHEEGPRSTRREALREFDAPPRRRSSHGGHSRPGSIDDSHRPSSGRRGSYLAVSPVGSKSGSPTHSRESSAEPHRRSVSFSRRPSVLGGQPVIVQQPGSLPSRSGHSRSASGGPPPVINGEQQTYRRDINATETEWWCFTCASKRPSEATKCYVELPGDLTAYGAMDMSGLAFIEPDRTVDKTKSGYRPDAYSVIFSSCGDFDEHGVHRDCHLSVVPQKLNDDAVEHLDDEYRVHRVPTDFMEDVKTQSKSNDTIQVIPYDMWGFEWREQQSQMRKHQMSSVRSKKASDMLDISLYHKRDVLKRFVEASNALGKDLEKTSDANVSALDVLEKIESMVEGQGDTELNKLIKQLGEKITVTSSGISNAKSTRNQWDGLVEDFRAQERSTWSNTEVVISKAKEARKASKVLVDEVDDLTDILVEMTRLVPRSIWAKAEADPEGGRSTAQ